MDCIRGWLVFEAGFSIGAVPFRSSEFQLLPSDKKGVDSEKSLLEDIIGTSVNEKERNQGTTDFALMQSMMSRVQQLEIQVQSQAKEIIEKDRTIGKYEQQLEILRKANEMNDSKSRNTELQAQCFILRKQVEQMEEFLADYGLIWVGDASDEEDNSTDTGDREKSVIPLTGRFSGYWNQDSSLAKDQPGNFVPNFEVLLKNIKELNVLAGEGQSKVVTDTTNNNARLKPTETIPLALYHNGLVLFDGPFRSYTTRETRQFLVDILDGYFPSELQGRFPDGVPFKVLDRREAVYKDKFTELFSGEGRRLKSAETSNASLRPQMPGSSLEELPMVTSEEHKLLSGKTMTEDQFLGKLPKNVIKSGKIVDIRDGVKGNLSGSGVSTNKREEKSSGLQVVETKLVQELRERINSSVPSQRGRPSTPRSGGLLVTLRIRSEDGSNTFVLKLRPSETIGDVRSYINSHRKQTFNNDYDIVQNFPTHMVFSEPKSTLEQCGLMSNAALFLRRKPGSNQVKTSSFKFLSSTTKQVQTKE